MRCSKPCKRERTEKKTENCPETDDIVHGERQRQQSRTSINQASSLRVFHQTHQAHPPVRPAVHQSINQRRHQSQLRHCEKKRCSEYVTLAWHGMPLAENIPSRLDETQASRRGLRGECQRTARLPVVAHFAIHSASRVASTPTANRLNILNNKSSASLTLHQIQNKTHQNAHAISSPAKKNPKN